MTDSSFAVATRDLLRERALDALGAQLTAQRWAEVTMAEVAAGAGVSRQTLYNEFGGRHDLALAYVVREADRFVAAIEGVVVEHRAHPREAIAAAFDLFLGLIVGHPLVRDEELLALVSTEDPVLARATDRLAGLMVEHFASAAEGDARLVADVTVRLAISHAAMPSGPTDLTAASVAAVLGPFIDQALS